MSISARLVVLVLLFLFPQVSFGIPPFSFRGVPPSVFGFFAFAFASASARTPTSASAFASASAPAPRDAAPSAQAPAGTAPATVTGDWVAQQVDRRDTGRDARSSMQMRLFDRQNRKRERTLTLIALDGDDAPAAAAASSRSASPGSKPGAPADVGSGASNVPATGSKSGSKAAAPADAIGDRLLIRFTYPNDIAGTSFLVWERAGADDERFLYLPAIGRVRRIAGAERQESFVGSDFTYEDIGGRALDDYTYTLLDANATDQDADGRAHPAYLLESRAKDADALYPRVVSHVRKDSFVVVRAEIFNRRNEREKEYRVLRLSQVEGIWTSLEVLMTNLLDRTRTEMTTTSVDYHVGLTERDFSRRELERGAR